MTKMNLGNVVAAEAGCRICHNCGCSDFAPDLITTGFWGMGEMVLVEDIPVLRCDDCAELFIDIATAANLKAIRDLAPIAGLPRKMIEVATLDFARWMEGTA